MKRILFLCSGNYYRSRFAEILFNHLAEQRGLPWQAESRGLAIDPRNPGPISQFTLSYLNAKGISCDSYLRMPQWVTDGDFAAAHCIVAVKELEHRPMMEARHATWRDAVEFWHVDDVDCATPDKALPHLEREIQALLSRLSAIAA
jgi:protein-tyrosine phosphatase